MDIREKHSLAKLFVESFALVNRSCSALLALALVALVGLIGFTALSLVLPRFLGSILDTVYTTFISVLFIKLIAAKAENDNASLADLASTAVLPTIYWIVLSLIGTLIATAVFFVMGLLGAGLHTWWIWVPVVIVGFVLTIRLLFTYAVIVLREQDPFSALVYSWQLTKGHFCYVLAAWLLAVLFPLLILAAVGYGAYVGIPLYFADSFNLAHLSWTWIGVFVFVILMGIFIHVSMLAFHVLVFLYLDYRNNRGTTETVDLLPSEAIDIKNALPPGAGPVVQAPEQNVEILKASVRSHDEDTLSQHLDQVYQPQPEELKEYKEEDRMPTLVFDEEMAKQIEESRAQWEQEKAKSRLKSQNDDDNTTTIKMSK
ncbi:MAG: glycerophosphoryl diester phosphodiesterase membrane domain-containing protein [Elusimicrobiaceae bacterium]|nr:glycerophosphoryl diester phosphodiesterase membrane domain-containing protein [Elusimicrobiaceae bacterium]